MANNRVTIIGAGILGCSAAYHLSRLGYRCRVVERETKVATHASGRSSGMFRCLYRHPQLTEWAVRTLSGLPKAIREQEIRQTGSVVVGRTLPDHHEGLFEEIKFRDPVRNRIDSAIHCNADGLITSESLTRAVAGLAADVGAQFLFNRRITEVRKERGNWIQETESNETFESDIVVNAAGAWLDTLAPVGASGFGAKPYVRHLYTLDTSLTWETLPDAGFLWDESDNYYIRKLDQGRTLFSICDESEQDPDAVDSPEEPARKEFDAKLSLFLKKFSSASRHTEVLAQRWCLRTYLADKLPLISEEASQKGYYWFGAFGGFGMSTGFAAAEDLAKAIAGDSSAISVWERSLSR